MTHFTRRQMIHAAGAAVSGLALGGTPRATMAQRATPEAPAGVRTDALDAFIATALEAYEVPGAAVAVVQGGAPVLVRGYGVRDIGSEEPVDADTVFQLASNTKVMTSFVAATLVEEGMLDWDEPIVSYLPEL